MTNGKILKLNNDQCYIGLEDGTIKIVNRQNMDFAPNIGDSVEIYESDGIVYVLKKTSQGNNGSGINFGDTRDNAGVQININNTNNNNEQRNPEPRSYPKEKKRVHKIVYILLAIFLGWIGIHKFYAGKTSAGVLYLLFCWTCIPFFIGFFEGIAAIFIKADNEGYIYI